MQTATAALSCYWLFELYPGMANGAWTLEVKVDGTPAGAHAFEIAGMTETVIPKQVTPDQIFKMISPSLVWVHKLDPSGHPFDTSTGFVLQTGVIATAFQSIDSASRLEIEFTDGRREQTDQLLALSRSSDWAMIGVNTGTAQPLTRGDPGKTEVGGMVTVFNFDAGSRVFGQVLVGATGKTPGFGSRIVFSPSLSPEAAGGPLLNEDGQLVGILGGNVTPGSRVGSKGLQINPGLWRLLGVQNAAVAINELPAQTPRTARSLAELSAAGILTAPVIPVAHFKYGGAVLSLPKDVLAAMPPDITDFSRRDQIYVYSMWAQSGKDSKGEITVKVYDPSNREILGTAPKKISLSRELSRYSVSFAAAPLANGIYRIDLNWNGQPAWRTFIRVAE